ncbi:MAG TPA: plasma-membrane proton-efflux P-type ATPase, partial [Desulfosarcina sp.]|nr:plasma-membrane proton-efflux P-type ATPase [Desulfosarcina sp.]
MDASPISTKVAQQTPVDKVMQQLDTRAEGLSDEEARRRRERFGANEISEKTASALVHFLGFLWGPIPWMIEAAAVLSLAVRHWVDFGIIVTLLVFNAAVGFWQEHQAGNAVAALKNKLALKGRVRREGAWKVIDARELVPGDVIRLRAGDIVPADAKLIDGDYLSVDQSALTGESLPAGKEKGDGVYSGSIARQGEMVALVVATGARTYFGRTARLVADAGKPSHFQKTILQIGDTLIYLSLGLVAVLIIVQLFRGSGFAELLQFALILTVASIPVAMPAVLSVTMAVGAMVLSKMKAIVSRLESVEEMAGMDVLCSDKTGTLTQNRLTVGDVKTFDAGAADAVLLAAALASKAENNDSIDSAVIDALDDSKVLEGFEALAFTPFDPVGKRTEATVRDKGGSRFKVTKGAPQVIMDAAGLDQKMRRDVQAVVEDLAGRGYRTLGVARTDAPNGQWRFLGILPLFDPPREDSAATIAQAKAHGIDVKMVTGDNLAIAREMAATVGLGQNIQNADRLMDQDGSTAHGDLAARIEAADGFAQVFPEHKHSIVKALQDKEHIVGMTGDGVNDAPALKQADVGIAVSGAT